MNDTQLRQIDIDGEPWLVGADICRALGMSVYGGPTQRLDADEQRRLARADYPSFDYGSRVPSLIFANESGLYKLIMRSDKPVARAFQNWVTRDVLPAIRKTGGYLLNEAMRETAVDLSSV